MNNKQTTLILGWMCLVGSFFTSFGVLFICSSIFFSAHFIIEALKKERTEHYILKSKVWLLYETYLSSIELGHSKESCQKYLDEIDRILNEEIK
jgi:hypothetical protein